MITIPLKLFAATTAGFILALVATLLKLAFGHIVREVRLQYDMEVIHEWELAADEYTLIARTGEGTIYKKVRAPYMPYGRHVDYQTMSQ